MIFEVFSKILWKIITHYLYIHRITYCPHFSSHFPNSFNWRMFMNLDSDIGSFLKNIMENNYILYIYIYIFRITHCIGSALKMLWKIITYYLYILRITYCPRFSSLFPNSLHWRMFMNLDSVILEAFPKILWEIIIYYFCIFRIIYCPRFSSLFQIHVLGECL